MIVLCGNLTIPYCGRFFHCFYLEERKNCATALAGHRAAILFNLDLYEILMDYDCLISKDLETNSIYEGAGDYLKDFKIENNHIYHCKNLKMTSLENAIANLMEE